MTCHKYRAEEVNEGPQEIYMASEVFCRYLKMPLFKK